MNDRLQAGVDEARSFRLKDLFYILAFISFTLGGWNYLGAAGAVFAFMAGFNLWSGFVAVGRIRTRRAKFPEVEMLRAGSCFVLSALAFSALVYWITKFSSSFGFGWWRNIRL